MSLKLETLIALENDPNICMAIDTFLQRNPNLTLCEKDNPKLTPVQAIIKTAYLKFGCPMDFFTCEEFEPYDDWKEEDCRYCKFFYPDIRGEYCRIDAWRFKCWHTLRSLIYSKGNLIEESNRQAHNKQIHGL